MVNKSLKNEEAPTVLLRFLFLLIISCFSFCSNCLQAQNIRKSYVASTQTDGILYFIVPQKGFANSAKDAKIEYDITYKTSRDSATFNFSYFGKNEIKVDSIGLPNGNKQILLYPKRIFVEPKKNKWHFRYTSTVLFSNLEQFFKQDANTAKIIIYSQGRSLETTIKKKTWEDQATIINKIFTMIKYNKQ